MLQQDKHKAQQNGTLSVGGAPAAEAYHGEAEKVLELRAEGDELVAADGDHAVVLELLVDRFLVAGRRALLRSAARAPSANAFVADGVGRMVTVVMVVLMVMMHDDA